MALAPTAALFDLTGKVAVVTGAGRGIGEVTAVRRGLGGAIVNFARAVLFFSCDTSRHVTGQYPAVDGGYLVG